eukprot:jgi/Tetstr1/440417/TSEL_028751.t1
MQHRAGCWLRNCLPSEVEAVDATVLTVVERLLGVSFDPSTYGTDTNPVVTDFLEELYYADARMKGRGAEAASASQKELKAFLDQANNSRLHNEAVSPGNTVPRDEVQDLVPDAELSLPAFTVVTESYDSRSLKPTQLEFETMRCGVKYTAVPQAKAVDWFERSLLKTCNGDW